MITLKTVIINAPAELYANLDQVNLPVIVVRHIAALRRGEITSPTSSVKIALRAIAHRCLALHEEIQIHKGELERMVRDKAPEWMASFGISTLTSPKC